MGRGVQTSAWHGGLRDALGPGLCRTQTVPPLCHRSLFIPPRGLCAPSPRRRSLRRALWAPHGDTHSLRAEHALHPEPRWQEDQPAFKIQNVNSICFSFSATGRSVHPLRRSDCSACITNLSSGQGSAFVSKRWHWGTPLPSLPKQVTAGQQSSHAAVWHQR